MSRILGCAILVAIIITLLPEYTYASRPTVPTGHVGPYLAPFRAPASSKAGTWTPLVNRFPGSMPDTALLMNDGTVMMHDGCTPDWYRLYPDSNGSYVTGGWSGKRSMQSDYAPLYFASAWFFGHLQVAGGEYNGSGCKEQVMTNKGAFFSPFGDGGWSPQRDGPWDRIGDAQSVVLSTIQPPHSKCQVCWIFAQPESRLISLESCGHGDYGKADKNDEEGWTLLPNGSVLTVDTWKGAGGSNSPAELFTPGGKSERCKWTPTGPTVNSLVDPISHEIGPALLLVSGRVLQVGANSCGDGANCPGHTGIYDPSAGTWIAGPDFPKISGSYYDVSDGPAALLRNGRVLIQTSPNFANHYLSPSHFFEFDEGTGTLTQVSEPTSAPNVASFEGRMLELPTGQILWSSDVGDVEVYTPDGGPDPSWQPVIQSVPKNLYNGQGNYYYLKGTLLHGLSEGAAYGDDAQMATNFPLVRITNSTTHHVCYPPTSPYNANGDYYNTVGYRGTTWAQIDMTWPFPCEAGEGKLQVVVNGIASKPVSVTVH